MLGSDIWFDLTVRDSIYGCSLSYWNKHYAVSFHFIHTCIHTHTHTHSLSISISISLSLSLMKRRNLFDCSCLVLSQKTKQKNNPVFIRPCKFSFLWQEVFRFHCNDKNSLTEIFTGPLVGPKVSYDWTEILNVAYVTKTCSAPETVNTPIKVSSVGCLSI
jgi:hypothetical protein